ncbi:MAG: hypothetical protein WC962_06285 [Phycisphaerae bacterium]
MPLLVLHIRVDTLVLRAREQGYGFTYISRLVIHSPVKRQVVILIVTEHISKLNHSIRYLIPGASVNSLAGYPIVQTL